MCGIAGIIGPGSKDQAPLAQAMGDLLRHRGPDDAGLWIDSRVILVHRRLSILDLSSGGHQPMGSSDGRYWITFNGEIYNYRELRAELEGKGFSFRTKTDTEVLLAAYQAWGRDCLKRLNGMWAFAIWDKVEERLFASRDRFGKKPFYYVTFQNRMYFASELKALLLIPGLPRSLNTEAMADFFAERASDFTEETLFRDLKQLSPASTLEWIDGRLRIDSYWTFPEWEEGTTDTGVVEEIRHLLEASVHLRLRADTPVGCLLSGGLDSSTVACLMKQDSTGAEPIHLFTTRVDPPVEEAAGIELLLKRGGYQSHDDIPTAQTFWEDLPQVLWHQEAPFADGSMVAHYRLMRLAREAGVPVLLTGQGADEVFAGYQGFLSLYQGELLRRGDPSALTFGGNVSTTLYHALPVAWRNALRTRRQRRDLSWIGPTIRQAIGRHPRYAPISRRQDPLNALLKRSMTEWTLPAFLRYEDRNAMAFGVETRLPYLDVRLVERLFRLSGKVKIDGGKTKSLLRQAAEKWVPGPIVHRSSKQAYPAPVSAWIRELRVPVEEIIHSSAVAASPLLDAKAWRQEAQKFWSDASAPMEPLWRGLIAHLWYEQLFKRDFSVRNASKSAIEIQSTGSILGPGMENQ